MPIISSDPKAMQQFLYIKQTSHQVNPISTNPKALWQSGSSKQSCNGNFKKGGMTTKETSWSI